jgi:hypothetical protein
MLDLFLTPDKSISPSLNQHPPHPPGAIYASQSCAASALSNCGAVNLLSTTLTSNTVEGGGGGALHARSIDSVNINCTFTSPDIPPQDAQDTGGVAAPKPIDLAAVASDALQSLPTTRDYTACPSWTSNTAPSPAYGPLIATAAYHLGLNTPSYLPAYARFSSLNISLSILDFFNQTISSGIPDASTTVTASCPQPVLLGQVTQNSYSGYTFFDTIQVA